MNQVDHSFHRNPLRIETILLVLTLSCLIVFLPIQPAYSASVAFGSQILLSNSANSSQNEQIVTTGTNVYVVWTDTTGVFFKASSNSGGTFASPVTISSSTTASLPQITATGTNVYVVWTDTTGVFFKASSDSGGTFAS